VRDGKFVSADRLSMPRRFASPFLLTAALGFLIPPAALAEVTVERSESGVTVKLDGQPFAEYLVQSGGKPIVWPIIGPTGKPLTRAYPMGEGADESHDHPHHRSLWFTHGKVSGVDFWLEGDDKGQIKHREFVKVQGGESATIITHDDWLGPDGKKVCEDERKLVFGGDSDARFIDVEITVAASEGPVTFGETKEGSFGVRTATTMRPDKGKGGQIVNSEGQTDKAAWGQQAAWVDYHGPVDGERVGIAIFNHPGSFRFPTHWHVRTYGLFAANPFMRAGHAIESGKTLTLRYRVFLHRGDEKEGKVAEAYERYANSAE